MLVKISMTNTSVTDAHLQLASATGVLVLITVPLEQPKLAVLLLTQKH